ncbi:hypothetical protein [Aquimarina sp. SS2-1]|uniref:hypothetical protein n=1 Tax=Aquimarina besae TaxID=3342247 RepID=UPI00366BE1AE
MNSCLKSTMVENSLDPELLHISYVQTGLDVFARVCPNKLGQKSLTTYGQADS